MKNNTGKKMCLLAVVVLLATLLAIPVLAADGTATETEIPMESVRISQAYPRRNGAVSAGGYYTEELQAYLISQFSLCKTSIDVSQFNIPNSALDQIRSCIWFETPEAFNVYSLGGSTIGGKLIRISVSYYDHADTPYEYATCWNACMSSAETLLEGIDGNDFLTDVQKALLLHDRLALWVEYAYDNYQSGTIPDTAYTMVGALQNRVAVCQGYTMAYMYLLDQVGIESDYCSSARLNHCWNIVYIGSTPYHVDVTWDDPVWDVTGQVYHDNFLRSTNGIIATGHDGGDFTINTPTSTTYDNYYWQNSNTAFQLLNGQIYYLDNEAEYIKRESNKSNVISVGANWRYYAGNFARLSATDTELLYSLNDAIYAYNPSTGSNRKIHNPSLYSGYAIYGFMYEDGKLIYEQFDSPSYQSSTKANYQERVAYGGSAIDKEAPSAVLTVTNNCASSQTVTIIMHDDVGIAGYYWGTNSTYTFNTYTADSSTGATKNVSESGLYYLTVKDANGNISQTYSIQFYKTTLDGNGGSVILPYVISARGETVQLPSATRLGYSFLGWATGSFANTPIYATGATYAPTTNTVLYAVWAEANINNGWVTINDKHYYYVNDVAQTGWLKLDGKWYYFNAQGAMQTGWVSVAGTWYYLNAAGVMQTGWIYNGGAWYYLKSSGAMAIGWLQQGSTWYYLKTSGAMVTGNYTIGTAVHKFNSSGVWLGEVKQTQKNGWVQESGKWYYYQNGSMAKGWKQVGGVWYYFKANGQMTTGWLQQGSTWYYLQSSGAMKTGWLQLGSTWYYFHSSGAMATGWLQQGNVWYFFDPSGAWVQR